MGITCVGIEIAHQRDDHVAGNVMLLEELHRIGRRERLQVRGITHGRAVVRIRRECRAEKLLDQPSGRIAVGAHAALFHHHVALLVELAQHRIGEAVRFDGGPQLNHVRRHGVHVAGVVIAGAGVHAHAAVTLDNLAELVLDDELVGGRHGVFPLLLQLRQLLRDRGRRA